MPQKLALNRRSLSCKGKDIGYSILPFITIFFASLFALAFDLLPLFIYIFFVIGSLLIGLLLNEYNEHSKIRIILFVILVLYLTAFIGFRDFGVGWDTNIYIDSYWENGSFIKKISEFGEFDYANGAFLMLSIIGHIFSNDHQTLLFLTALVINLFTFLAVFIANAKKIRINWVIYLFFWQMLFMNNSMNLMRQYCAMSLMLLSVLLFFKKKWLWSILCVFIAVEFHTSAIVGIFPFLFYVLDKNTTPFQRNLLTVSSLILLYIATIGIFQLLSSIIDMGFLNAHFVAYTDNFTAEGENLFGVSYLTVSALFVYICVLLYKKRLMTNGTIYMLISIYAFSFILRMAAFSLVWLSRLSDYYNYYVYFALAYLVTVYSKKIPIVVQAMVYTCVLYTWLNSSIIHPGGATYPYHSAIFGI